MAKLTHFNGGFNVATAPHLIKENEGIFYDNIDHVKGTLRAIKDKKRVIPDASRFGHFFTRNSTWYWSDVPKDYVEFQERLYIGDRHGVSTKVINNVEYNLGIVPPTARPDVAATSYLLADLEGISFFTLGVIVNPLGDIPNELDLEYRVINESDTGALSAGETTFEVKTGTLGPNAVYITIADKGWTNNVHIYRKHLGDWRLMKTVAFDANLDFDKQPVITDDVYDISANTILNEGALSEVGNLTGKLQYAVTFYSSITGIESVPVITSPIVNVTNGIVELANIEVSIDPQVDKKRIYRIGGNLTAFHLVDTINNVITEYTDNIADLDLSGALLESSTNFPPVNGMNWLTESYAMLFAADGDKLVFTPIGEPDSWPQTYYLDFPAFITGIGKTPVGLLVFTRFETFLVTGTGPLALSQQLLSGSQGCVSGDSVVNVQGAVYWASTDGVCISEGGKVIVYTRPKITRLNLTGAINAVVHDQNYYILTEDLGTSFILDVERGVIKSAHYDIRSYIVANDVLYGFRHGYLNEIEAGSKNLSMSYLSPAFIGAGLTVQKVYKNVFIYSKGDIQFEIYIDGKLVQQVEFTDTDNHQVKIPSEETRGFQIAFVVHGTGIVYEISWSDGNANQ